MCPNITPIPGQCVLLSWGNLHVMLIQSWSSNVDSGPTLNHHRIGSHRLLGNFQTQNGVPMLAQRLMHRSSIAPRLVVFTESCSFLSTFALCIVLLKPVFHD